MKKETQELIDWIKKQMSLAKDCCIRPAWGENHETYNKDFEAAVAFLDSLPAIEKRLCLGGYIRDSDGTPCCNGDCVRVEFKYYESQVTSGLGPADSMESLPKVKVLDGTLLFELAHYQWFFKPFKKDYMVKLNEVISFHKI